MWTIELRPEGKWAVLCPAGWVMAYYDCRGEAEDLAKEMNDELILKG